jgi:hypothetical protein
MMRVGLLAADRILVDILFSLFRGNCCNGRDEATIRNSVVIQTRQVANCCRYPYFYDTQGLIPKSIITIY